MTEESAASEPSVDTSERSETATATAVADEAAGADATDESAARDGVDRTEIEETIELIRPALQMDGGDIALVDVTDEGDVQIQLHGSCVGCPASLMTLKAGIERIMKDRHPAVREIVAIEG